MTNKIELKLKKALKKITPIQQSSNPLAHRAFKINLDEPTRKVDPNNPNNRKLMQFYKQEISKRRKRQQKKEEGGGGEGDGIYVGA